MSAVKGAGNIVSYGAATIVARLLSCETPPSTASSAPVVKVASKARTLELIDNFLATFDEPRTG